MKVNRRQKDVQVIQLSHSGITVRYEAVTPARYGEHLEESPDLGILEIEFRDLEEVAFLMRALEGFVHESELFLGEWQRRGVRRGGIL